MKSQILAGGRGLGTFKNGFQGGVKIVEADKVEDVAGIIYNLLPFGWKSYKLYINIVAFCLFGITELILTSKSLAMQCLKLDYVSVYLELIIVNDKLKIEKF